MFKRNKADKGDDLDSAWNEDADPIFGGAADHTSELDEFGAGDTDFPAPHEFKVEADEVPADEDALEEDTDLPFDEEDVLDPDADDEEFLEGSEDDFVDDSHEDYYDYGDRKHGVHDDAADEDDDAEDDGDDEDDADGNADDAPDETPAVAPLAAAPAAAAQPPAPAVGKHGRHGAVPVSKRAQKKQAMDQLPDHQRKSIRMRRILTVVIILLVLLLGGLAYFAYQVVQTNNATLTQQTNQSATDVGNVSSANNTTKDASTANTKKTNVPALVQLMGKTQDEAVKFLGHGATLSLATDVNEEGNPVKKRLTVVLTDEPADTKSGTPTVYLGLNEAGQVIMAGYSAATSTLGYGSLSFADAVTNEHVIEKTLNEAGLNLPDNTVTLPARTSYSTYASDGTTLVKENCSFNGSATVGASNYTWSAVLVYDYTAANASGNLADTVRQIYVYVNAA